MQLKISMAGNVIMDNVIIWIILETGSNDVLRPLALSPKKAVRIIPVTGKYGKID